MDAGPVRWVVLLVACTASACEPEAPPSGSEPPAAAARAAAAPSTQATQAGQSAFAQLQPRTLTSGDGQLAFDFGRVPAGELVRHLFAFQWEGAAPLLPTDLRSDCGCLTAAMYTRGADGRPVEHALNQPLPLHAPFVIQIELDTRAMAGGDVRKSVTLFSEEPPGVLRLAVKGHVD